MLSRRRERPNLDTGDRTEHPHGRVARTHQTPTVLHFPPGLAGVITGVPLCPEAQANAGDCSPESQIGETVVSSGLAAAPYTVTGGKVYLTEPTMASHLG
jgi:hypothetical protein